MDILDRIVEAVAQKLISMRLEENKYSYSEIEDTNDPNAGRKSGSSNPGNKPKENKGKKNFHQKEFVPPKGTKKLSPEQAGASGGERARTGDISKGPNKEKVKKTPVRPVRNDNDSKKGGQEAGRGGDLAAVTAHFRKTRGNR
jgi:hypothetical protein